MLLKIIPLFVRKVFYQVILTGLLQPVLIRIIQNGLFLKKMISPIWVYIPATLAVKAQAHVMIAASVILAMKGNVLIQILVMTVMEIVQ